MVIIDLAVFQSLNNSSRMKFYKPNSSISCNGYASTEGI